MKEFELPSPLKTSYALALILMIAGMVFTNDLAVATAAIIIVVLNVGQHILEAIHGLKATK